MACSCCRSTKHNIQTCDSVRRCGQCGRHGHDRRNCPSLAQFVTDLGDELTTIEGCSMRQLRKLCVGGKYLIHLYWPKREEYFERSRDLLEARGYWLFVATPHHGVHRPERRTINFLVADDVFMQRYERAAAARGFRHGVMVLRSAVEGLASLPGYDYAEVYVGHPKGYGVSAVDDYWRFDLGNHRYGALHDLQSAKVVRLATPDGVAARRVRIPSSSIAAWW